MSEELNARLDKIKQARADWITQQLNSGTSVSDVVECLLEERLQEHEAAHGVESCAPASTHAVLTSSSQATAKNTEEETRTTDNHVPSEDTTGLGTD